MLTHKRNLCSHSLSCVQLFVTPWTAAHQAPLSIGFLRQEYHIGLLFPPPGDLLDPGMEPKSLYLLHCRQILYHCITWEADPQMHCLKHSVCMLSQFSRVQPFVTPWTVAHQAPLSMEFSRQEYWSGIHFPGDLPDPRIKPRSPAWQADSLTSEPPGKSSKAETMTNTHTQTLRHPCIPKPTHLRTNLYLSPENPLIALSAPPGKVLY